MRDLFRAQQTHVLVAQTQLVFVHDWRWHVRHARPQGLLDLHLQLLHLVQLLEMVLELLLLVRLWQKKLLLQQLLLHIKHLHSPHVLGLWVASPLLHEVVIVLLHVVRHNELPLSGRLLLLSLHLLVQLKVQLPLQ